MSDKSVLSKNERTKASGYKTGFCGSGLCEGTAPRSMSGKPMKVCTFWEICSCSCHDSLTSMYQSVGMERLVHQNPEYVPVQGPDLSEYFVRSEELDGRSIGAPSNDTGPVEKPSETAPGLLESARTFDGTPSGYRQRGQLEVEVQSICHRAMMGEFDVQMTPAAIAELINPSNPPSTGAIAAVFSRWERIGYAIIHRKPLYFQSYTVDGMKLGLEALKRRGKRSR